MQSRILVVDDEALLLNAMTRSLDLYYELEIAESGFQALELIAKSAPFDVILSDLRMPEMDGIEFLQLAIALSPDSVCMLLTGNQDLAAAQSAVRHGDIFRVMEKPCNKAELIRNIEEAIKLNHTARANRQIAEQAALQSN